jgi:hypothetical protein
MRGSVFCLDSWEGMKEVSMKKWEVGRYLYSDETHALALPNIGPPILPPPSLSSLNPYLPYDPPQIR